MALKKQIFWLYSIPELKIKTLYSHSIQRFFCDETKDGLNKGSAKPYL